MVTDKINNPCAAYLVSEYPAISHTFIFREIKELRKSGFNVKTVSIRKPDMAEKMTREEQEEIQNTLYIKNSSCKYVIYSHLKCLLKSPSGYLTMFLKTILFSKMGHISLIKSIAYFTEAGVLLNWMFDNKIPHIHVHFANPAATVIMIASCYGLISYSLSIHGPDIFYNIDNNLLKEKCKHAKKIRCIGYYCRSQLMNLLPYKYWNKLHIVRCGIDPSGFLPRKNNENNIPQILCVGRLVSAKGQHILLEACAILKKRRIRHRLIFIGDGPDRHSLEQLAKKLDLADSVTFTGAAGQDQVKQFYDKADIFVLPSFAEGIPVVLMEAMAKQIPCITTSITGIPELITHNKEGLLFTPSDVNDLADKIDLLLRDKNLRNEMGLKARDKIINMYNIEKNCKEMAAFFSN